jgi:hypothetical protein
MIRNTPRIHGWMRQKKVYVPGGKFFGVRQVTVPTPGVPTPSSPESKACGPFARGYANP